MDRKRSTIHVGLKLLLISVLSVVSLFQAGIAWADDGPERREVIEVSYTEYTWWLRNWADRDLVCTIILDHPGEPYDDEIYFQCGGEVYLTWKETAPCSQARSGDSQECSGMYLHYVGSQFITRQIEVDLPKPSASIDLINCVPVLRTDLCGTMPSLYITAEESLPNEEITRLEGTLGGSEFTCLGNTCEVPLESTGEEGVVIEFWAESTFGDSSETYSGRIRVTEGHDDYPFATGWKVEIVSDTAVLNNLKGCAGIWQSFPPLSTPPDWLLNPSFANLLITNQPYTLLAGQLIRKGYVDTWHCDDYGMTVDGYASQCGIEASRDLVNLWQNTFDKYIVATAKESGIPSWLLKRIFARESQFWPETTQDLYREYGFGHTTELGADTTLLWNQEFFDQFCPLVLSAGKCRFGYSHLTERSQILLRGALLSEMEVFLPYYEYELDQDQIEESVSLFSETLLGNCTQVGQMIYNETDQVAGEIVSYEDLWRFTLANYQGGPGCLAEAITEVYDEGDPLTWENLSPALEPNCPWVLDYVADIAR